MPRQIPGPQNTESVRSQYGKPATGRFGFVFVALRVMVPMRGGRTYFKMPVSAPGDVGKVQAPPPHRFPGDDMASYTDIAVRSSVENVQNLVQHAFAANGFNVKWENATKGKAEKGSKGLNIALGALAQYFGIDFEIFPQQDAATLRLIKANSGWAGGAIGAIRVKKQFEELGDTLTTWFQSQGVLQGVRKD